MLRISLYLSSSWFVRFRCSLNLPQFREFTTLSFPFVSHLHRSLSFPYRFFFSGPCLARVLLESISPRCVRRREGGCVPASESRFEKLRGIFCLAPYHGLFLFCSLSWQRKADRGGKKHGRQNRDGTRKTDARINRTENRSVTKTE